VGFKTGGGGTINEDRKRHSGYTTHDSGHQFSGESHGEEGLLQETPLYPIIGFSHIKFNTYITVFFSFRLFEVMKNFKGNEGVISDKSTR
jgi:hypothetical protein